MTDEQHFKDPKQTAKANQAIFETKKWDIPQQVTHLISTQIIMLFSPTNKQQLKTEKA